MLRSCSSRSRRSRSRAMSRRARRGRLPHDCLEVFEQVATDRVVESLEFSSRVLDAAGGLRRLGKPGGTDPALAFELSDPAPETGDLALDPLDNGFGVGRRFLFGHPPGLSR